MSTNDFNYARNITNTNSYRNISDYLFLSSTTAKKNFILRHRRYASSTESYSSLSSSSSSSSFILESITTMATAAISSVGENDANDTGAQNNDDNCNGAVSATDADGGGAASGCSSTPSSFETMRFIKVGLLALMFILIFCGNTFVLVALNNRKLRKNRMYFFLVHLSIADLVTGFFNVLPQLAWEVARRLYGGNILCKSVKFLQILGPYLSSYILIMTSIDRYQAICHPLSNHQNTRRSRWMVAIAWTLSLLFCTPQSIIFSYQKVSESTDDYECWGTFPEQWMLKMYVTWYAISVFMVPFLILTWTHYFICREIWLNWHNKRQSLLVKPEKIINQSNTNSNNCSNSGSPKISIDKMKSSKYYTLSTGQWNHVNQLIHRLSNSGLEKSDQSEWKTMPMSTSNPSNNKTVMNYSHQSSKPASSAGLRLFWLNNRKMSSSSDSSDSSSQLFPAQQLQSQFSTVLQKCPLHQHEFRHHTSQHRSTTINRPESLPKQSTHLAKVTLSADGDWRYKDSLKKELRLRHSKSESEILIRKQEKEFKRKRLRRGSITDSLISADSLTDVTNAMEEETNGIASDQLNIKLSKSDKLIYETSESLDKRIRQWLVVRKPSYPPLTKTEAMIMKKNNEKQPHKVCLCCPECCTYCFHAQNDTNFEKQKHSLFKTNSNTGSQTKYHKPTMVEDCDLEPEESKTLVVVRPSEPKPINSSSMPTKATTVPHSSATVSHGTDSTQNVVNVFVPRTYHINAGNKRMSNPRIHSMHGLTRAKIKTVKITLVVITCYVLCSSPFICVQLWAQFWPNAQDSPIYKGPVIAILMLLPSLNSCVNPWIYIYFNPNLITLFCQFFKRKSSSEDHTSKSYSMPNNQLNHPTNHPTTAASMANVGGNWRLNQPKSHKKFSNNNESNNTDSLDCSTSLTECTMTRSIRHSNPRIDLIDMKKPGAGFKYTANRLTPSMHPPIINTPPLSPDAVCNPNVSINSLVRYLDNSRERGEGPSKEQSNGRMMYHRDSAGSTISDHHKSGERLESKVFLNEINPTTIVRTKKRRERRSNSLSFKITRMWTTLSLKSTSTTSSLSTPKPAIKSHRSKKSSQLRLYKTTNVECVVEDDQFIV